MNPRASRTVPFVSKATGIALAKVAARCMVGRTLAQQGVTHEVIPPYYAVKEAVFPFIKFPGVDTILGPEMKSTGEVMGVGQSFAEAFVKSQLAAGVRLPKGGKAFLSVRNADKARVIDIARELDALGFALVATKGTAAALEHAGLKVQPVNKVQEGSTAYRGHAQEPRGELHREHRGGRPPLHPGFVVHPEHGAAQPHHLLHNACRSARCLPGHAPPAGAASLRHPVPTSHPAMTKIPITLHGADLLKTELHRLKTVDRPGVITAIAEARAQGDITENAEYEAARERQGFIEGRIIELEAKLANAQVIDPALLEDDGRVVFGTTVELAETSGGEPVSYQIVGEDEADIKQGKISYSSPIAKALIGKYSGDVAEVRTPGGVKEFEIVDVKYL